MLFFNTKIIAHFNEKFAGSPKSPVKLMERLRKLILRYFEERSRVSCRCLSRFLSALMFIFVMVVDSAG